MDPPPRTAFSGRRRSSLIPPEDSAPPSQGSWAAPRKASTCDSADPAPPGNPTATDISARRASATADNSTAPSPEYPSGGSFAGRKASNWDDPLVGGGGSGSASDIAGRRATATDRPPWDRFAGPPPDYKGSTWAWMSDLTAVITPSTAIITERSRLLYAGNVDYIFDNFSGKSLAMDDIKAVMYAYGVEEDSAEDVANNIDPKMYGVFSINAQNKQILLPTNLRFSEPRDPLNNLRHGSKCFQQNLLSPLHFAGYIFEILIASGCLEGQPSFMLLGMYGILGVLKGANNDSLTTKNVETFMSMWKILDQNVAQDLKDMINGDFSGTISCMDFYNMLYRRNAFGKQRIEIFDTKGAYDPSFFFPLLDKDEDGFLLPSDLKSFASIFGRAPSDEAIYRVIGKLDLDGDSKINVEDFRRAMMPVFHGMTWEFWLVAILLTLKL